jgi:NAD-dependent dihydropyrimidine dehydrogenase PreA subunit
LLNLLNTPAAFDETRPLPIIDAAKCNGCGICIPACPNHVLEMQDEKAVVSNPQACEYAGECELICPTQAITRPFLILPG